MTMYDTHAHLQDPIYESDRDEIVKRAKSLLSGVIIPSYDRISSRNALSLFANDSFFKVTVGVHPHYAESCKDLTFVEEMGNISNGIGEIGLDYYRNLSPREIQKKVFYEQLLIAKDLKKFIIIHERDAFSDVWDIINAVKPETPVIFHCFSHGAEEIKKILSVDNYIPAFCGNITYNRSENIRRALEVAYQSGKLLFETDSPWLSPVPLRGKRNEPRNVFYIYEFSSRFLQVGIDVLSNITSKYWGAILGEVI